MSSLMRSGLNTSSLRPSSGNSRPTGGNTGRGASTSTTKKIPFTGSRLTETRSGLTYLLPKKPELYKAKTYVKNELCDPKKWIKK